MFLQRLARSIHGRDWFTVLIEVLIVVAGILIGLQVNNWNESRKSAAWERRFLTDLAIEFQTNREQLWQVLELQKRRGSALDDVRERALHGKDATVLADVEKYYSLAMSSNRTFFPTKGVYLSALSTGSIDEVRNTNLRYAIMNIYERAYPRLVYNGEIYDERSDQVSWDGRQDFDPGDGSLTRLEYVQSQRFVANVRFLSEQNRVYLGLAESALTKLDAVILELPDSSVTADSEIAAVSPASE